ncbi:ABC transporter substrate-binding protein [Desulfospira joergensenii]|uniref:ABC transporter substrate-binding protein n=1 Tax=Desulfospira joergensenii TaxID=53329 RepID=UPI0003B359CB|nr:ABC transporter substrate binding protein [Desulfospira joergensenii]
MKIKNIESLILGLALLLFPGGLATAADNAMYKVLVVMSYGPDYQFVEEVQQGIESVLSETCRIETVYMNTRKNFPGGPQKAKEAYELYKKLRPDGVIASDDNAQSMFVVPYLKDKVKTPVMFCGVNATSEKYGYPASNVSGILERHHISQTLAFTKQLIPSIKTFGLMAYESPTGRAILKNFQQEEKTFPMELVAARFPKTLDEAEAMARELRPLCDVLYMPTMQGLKDEKGNVLSERDSVPAMGRAFVKPIVTGNNYSIKYGVLCGIVKTGQEQGSTAAKMLLKAMEGTPVSQIPITRNRLGKAIINVTVMKALGIKPKPILLKGTELVRTDP